MWLNGAQHQETLDARGRVVQAGAQRRWKLGAYYARELRTPTRSAPDVANEAHISFLANAHEVHPGLRRMLDERATGSHPHTAHKAPAARIRYTRRRAKVHANHERGVHTRFMQRVL